MMLNMGWRTCVLLTVVGVISFGNGAFAEEHENQNEEKKPVMSAKVVSCTGWRLNKLPEVKRFINRDVPSFHNVEFKSKPGASPELFLLDEDEQPVEIIDLSRFDQKGCNDLLIKKGFFKKEHMATEIPEKYLTGPYVEIPDEPEADAEVEVDSKQEHSEL